MSSEQPRQPAQAPPGYTRADQFIAVLHHALGHDKAAAYLGVPSGDVSACRLCHPELGPIDYTR